MQESLNTIISYSWIKYRGCLIERVWSGFKRNGKYYATLADAQSAIDQSLLNLQKSITCLSVTK